MTKSSRLTYVHVGGFSGSAGSLRKALASYGVSVRSVDLQEFTRQPRLAGSRVLSLFEAARGGNRAPWTKTRSWSEAVQRELGRQGLFGCSSPWLVVQTLAALEIPDVQYCVYTDRVGLEGRRVGGAFASRFTPGWLERERSFLRGAQHVYLMGPSTVEVLVNEYELEPSSVTVVGAGPNVPLGSQSRSAKCERLLFVGTQWDLKGGPELLRVYERIKDRHPGLRLTLVGSGPPGPVSDGVIRRGRVDPEDMDQVYSESDAVVIPTHMEAFGISLVEALIKGLPCIASNVGNQPWIVGDAGRCVVPGDVDDLEDALMWLIENYHSVAERARRRGHVYSGTMRWDRVAERILVDMSKRAALQA